MPSLFFQHLQRRTPYVKFGLDTTYKLAYNLYKRCVNICVFLSHRLRVIRPFPDVFDNLCVQKTSVTDVHVASSTPDRDAAGPCGDRRPRMTTATPDTQCACVVPLLLTATCNYIITTSPNIRQNTVISYRLSGKCAFSICSQDALPSNQFRFYYVQLAFNSPPIMLDSYLDMYVVNKRTVLQNS